MPHTNQQHAFIWYHAEAEQEEQFIQWLQHIQETLHIQGELYKRLQNEKTTFMELFACVDSAAINHIEHLATQHDCFHGIQRRCESFERINLPS